MTRDDIIKIHETLSSKGRELIKKKNHDYCGGEKVDPFSNFRSCEQMGICTPEQGILVRLSDKFRRIVTAVTLGELKVEDENFEDTTIDFVNYVILLYCLRQEKVKTLVQEKSSVYTIAGAENIKRGDRCYRLGMEVLKLVIPMEKLPEASDTFYAGTDLLIGEKVTFDSTMKFMRRVEEVTK